LPRASKRQLKSLIASLEACVPPKLAGFTAGTPPMRGGRMSHTVVLPLPRGREATIWKSGRTLRSVALQLKVDVPTGRPLMPGLAST